MRELIIGSLIASLLLSFPGCTSIDPEPSWDKIAKQVPRAPRPQPTLEAKGKIQPGDTLIITVWEHAELSRERTVSPEGFLPLPLFGEMKVSGRTPAELEKLLCGEMTPYIKNPIIWVERKVKLTKKITVLGAVAKPGNYEFPKAQEIKLLPLLGAAGGYTESAMLEKVRIFRTDPVRPGPRQEIRVNLRKLLAHPLTKDVSLQENDVVILESTPTSKWNMSIRRISPTLQLIALGLGIIYVNNANRELRDRD